MPTNDSASITHLLRRTEYVARPSRVSALVGLPSLDAAIDDILNVTTPVALPTSIDHDIDGHGWDQYVEATQWWFDRMVDSPKPIQEKMTFFWHGHFTSAWDKVNSTFMMMTQNKLYRDNALGNFRTLAQAMAVQPAMLVYLDNVDNRKGSPNENFARELLELFTLGIGNYAESDVEAAAKAWTGHGIDWTETSPTYEHYKFTTNQHDKTQKTFLGRTFNFDGPDIIDQILVNDAAKKLVSARFIIAKLWEYFAHPGPPAAVLDALQAGFAADWDIKGLLKRMFLRDEFYSATAKQGLLRSPVDWVVATMYQTGLRSAVLNPQWYVGYMGQVPFNPPNVAGWKSNGYWINTTTVGARAEFAQGVTWHLRDSYDGITKMTIPTAVSTMADLFGLNPLSVTSYNALSGYLTAQRAAQPYGDWWEPTNLLTMSMLAPEMHQA
ncbi:MAG: hypothetical protein JWL72_4592 [Ilumatobacteraceae bacterium]|nr:hypothetical protein [Ilumatobacteraceae bacterium]